MTTVSPKVAPLSMGDWYAWANALNADEAWQAQLDLCYRLSRDKLWNQNEIDEMNDKVRFLQGCLRDLDSEDKLPKAFKAFAKLEREDEKDE